MTTSGRIPRERNTRLRAVMTDQNVTMADLATATGCNVKTVQRWVYEGRVPHPDHAEPAARLLNIDPNWLWPKRRAQPNPELVNLYAHIGDVPRTIWTLTAHEARHSIDIATDVAAGLPHGLAAIIHTRLSQGVKVRLCLGAEAASTLDITGAPVRVTSTRPMIGIYRFDDQMLVWLNRTGPSLDYLSPVMHLRRTEQRGVFDFYQGMFERWWQDEHIIHHGTDWFRAA